MFGAIYGDVIGSYYEVHCTKEVNFPFQSDSTFTDDSVLTAAVGLAVAVILAFAKRSLLVVALGAAAAAFLTGLIQNWIL